MTLIIEARSRGDEPAVSAGWRALRPLRPTWRPGSELHLQVKKSVA